MKNKALGSFVLLVLAAAPLSAEGAPIRLRSLGAMERIGQDQEVLGESAAAIAAARNETESFQIVVAAPEENITVTSVEISDLTTTDGRKIGRENVTLYREEYVRVRRPTRRAELPPGLYPDPLVPLIDPLTGEPIEPLRRSRPRWGGPTTTSGYDMYGLPFEVFRGQNQPIWADVRAPRDAAAGVYRGEVTVAAAGGIRARLLVTLTVWDFTLPDGPTHRNHFGSFRNVARYFDVKSDSERFRQIEMRYCEAMAEHRINPPLPASLLPEINADGSLKIISERHEALKRFLDRLHVTDFEVPRAPFARLPVSADRPDYKEPPADQKEKAQRYYRQYFDYLKANGWEKRAYAYLWDEPNLKENYEQVLVLGELVREAAPGLQRLVVEQTYPQDPSWPDIDPAVDIWCPLWAFIDRESIAAKIAEGDEVWSYTALVQRAPRYHPQYESVRDRDPPYWHIDRPLIVYRIPAWINRQYGITGLLYWSTVTYMPNPWANPAFAHPTHYNGGGFLFYPGAPCGIDGPIASIRLKNLRDGMEDYEYFVLLERAAGGEAVKSIVDQVAPNWWDYCRDPERLAAARREMAQAIVRAQGAAGGARSSSRRRSPPTE